MFKHVEDRTALFNLNHSVTSTSHIIPYQDRFSHPIPSPSIPFHRFGHQTRPVHLDGFRRSRREPISLLESDWATPRWPGILWGSQGLTDLGDSCAALWSWGLISEGYGHWQSEGGNTNKHEASRNILNILNLSVAESDPWQLLRRIYCANLEPGWTWSSWCAMLGLRAPCWQWQHIWNF